MEGEAYLHLSDTPLRIVTLYADMRSGPSLRQSARTHLRTYH